jgi:hypothetical protein
MFTIYKVEKLVGGSHFVTELIGHFELELGGQ